MRLGPALLLALLAVTFASEESCMGRCENGYSSEKTCQCDSMCRYYRSCCYDYQVVCRMTTRGDTFVLAEDDDDALDSTPTPATGHSRDDESDSIDPRRSTPTLPPVSTPAASTTQDIPLTEPEIAQEPLDLTPQRVSSTQVAFVSQRVSTTQKVLEVPVTQADLVPDPVTTATTVEVTTATTVDVTPATTVDVTTATTVDVTTATTVEVTTDITTTDIDIESTTTEAPDPDAHKCSGNPFDSFLQMKNGSIFAFRGDYFFELGRKKVMPGYPKLIKDVWGIRGPIDAAFTRVNCLGKTYIFKGNKYWRFDDGVLDDDYPRAINVGFDKVPDHVDAAFSLPAHSHHGKEKVYFFKGDQYFQYEFLHQPSHEECVSMNERSPSTLFSRYTDLHYDHYQHFFSQLFPDMLQGGHGSHHFINKDWKGIKSPVDAVMAGRLYVPPLNQGPDQQTPQQYLHYQQYQHQQQYQQYGHQWDQQYGQQWGRSRQRRSPSWESMAEHGMGVGQGFAKRGMEMGLRMAERRTEMEERLRQDWDRRNDRDRDQERRYEQNQDRRYEQNRDQDWDQDRRNNDRDQDRRNNDRDQDRRNNDQDQDRRNNDRDQDRRNNDRDQDRRNNDQDRDRHQYDSGNYDSRDNRDDGARGEVGGLPLQNIYFFKGDKYYRVNLKTKRVDPASPPYPRSIAQYWLGCSDTTGRERK